MSLKAGLDPDIALRLRVQGDVERVIVSLDGLLDRVHRPHFAEALKRPQGPYIIMGKQSICPRNRFTTSLFNSRACSLSSYSRCPTFGSKTVMNFACPDTIVDFTHHGVMYTYTLWFAVILGNHGI